MEFLDISRDFGVRGVRIPKVPEYSKYDSKRVLTKLCLRGLEEKGVSDKPEYMERLNKEIDTLERLGFIDYLLMVHHLIRWCIDEGIPTGEGRGSAAGSIVAWLLGVTSCDPIKHNLFFERFLNEARVKQKDIDGIKYSSGDSVPDIDIDFSFLNRKRFISDYLMKIYKGRVCKISTFTTYSSKLCLKEFGKIGDECKEEQMNVITKNVEVAFGSPRKINGMLTGDDGEGVNKHVKEWADKYPRSASIALKLEGLVKNYGVHASGYIISFNDLNSTMPYHIVDGEYVSAYDMGGALELAIKLDILGLRTLDVLYEAEKDIVKHTPEFRIKKINTDDEFIYQNLQNVECPYGLFQVSKGLGYKTLKDVSPKNINQLSDILAIGRPGSMAFIPKYLRYIKNGELESLHPLLDPYLEDTAGVILYQEQLMKIACDVFGCSMSEADELRKVVAKKNMDKLKEFEVKFLKHAEENSIDKAAIEAFWKVVEASAKYSFNKSHSFSYATISALTAYVKFKYPLEFFKNCLVIAKYEQKPHEEYSQIIKELKRFGIKILPPSISENNIDFEIVGKDSIRIGLSSLKGISVGTFEKLKNYSDNRDNKFSVFSSVEGANIPINAFESLIKAGCFSEMERNRHKFCLEARCWGLLTKAEKNTLIEVGGHYDYDLFEILRLTKEDKRLFNGKLFMKKTRFDNFSKKAQPFKEKYLDNLKSNKLIDYFSEVEICGFSYSQSLIDIFSDKSGIVDIATALENHGSQHKIVFRVIDIEEKISKNNNKYVKLTIGDESAESYCMSFKPDQHFPDGLPKIGSIMIGFMDANEDSFFISDVKVLCDGK